MKTEVPTGLTEVATGYAKHGNVKAEVPTGLTEVATGYAKHGNVKAEVPTGLTEVANGKTKQVILPTYQGLIKQLYKILNKECDR